MKSEKSETQSIKKALVKDKMPKTFIVKDEINSRTKIYYIHDNGGKPFTVEAVKKEINIYTYINDEHDENDTYIYNHLVKKITKFIGYWSGYDSSVHGVHGNSILIQISKNSYIFVGSTIYSFKTNDLIENYISYVGNNDVPYPVAYGEKYVYFMVESKYVSNDRLITPINPSNADNIYSEFYGHIHAKNNKNLNPKKIKNMKLIHKRKW